MHYYDHLSTSTLGRKSSSDDPLGKGNRHRVLVRWPSIVSFLFILMQLFPSSYWDPFLPSKDETLGIFSVELHSRVLLKAVSVFQLVCPLWAAETGSGALTLQSAWKTEMDRFFSILKLTEPHSSYLFLLFSSINTTHSHANTKVSTFLAFLW